jgi:hypothetical protein
VLHEVRAGTCTPHTKQTCDCSDLWHACRVVRDKLTPRMGIDTRPPFLKASAVGVPKALDILPKILDSVLVANSTWPGVTNAGHSSAKLALSRMEAGMGTNGQPTLRCVPLVSPSFAVKPSQVGPGKHCHRERLRRRTHEARRAASLTDIRNTRELNATIHSRTDEARSTHEQTFRRTRCAAANGCTGASRM